MALNEIELGRQKLGIHPGRRTVSKHSMHLCYILDYSRLRNREPLIALGSHRGVRVCGCVGGGGGGGGGGGDFCVRGP